MVFQFKYVEIEPGSELKPFIKSFWYLEKEFTNGKPVRERVFPAGCVEILFHFGSQYKSCKIEENRFEEHPRFYIFGQIGKAYKIQQTGRVEVIGCRFFPGVSSLS